MAERLTKKELNKIWFRWARFHLSSMSYEKIQGYNWAFSLYPIIQKYYENNDEEAKKLLLRHTTFYNTEPQTGALINGIVTGLEEERALGKDISDDMIHGVKTTLMGPIAGIGDAIVQGVIVPILLSIAMGLSEGGSIIGPLFYIIAWGITGTMISYTSFNSGYKLGFKAVDSFISEDSKKIRDAFNILGIIVVGGLSSSYVTLNTIFEIPYGNSSEKLQNILDMNFPKLLPLLAVILAWYLLSNKKMSSTKVLLVLTVIVTIGVLLGIF